MTYYLAITDNSWFQFLARRRPDEVNFWRPGSTTSFRAIEPGAPFLFKLHSPQNYVVGGGFFVRHTTLPLSLAWEAFGEKNGAENLDDFRRTILNLRQRLHASGGGEAFDPFIGCTILAEPFFFDEADWIAVPRDWSPNIVTGKRYDTDTPIGRALWNDVRERLPKYPPAPNEKAPATTGAEEEERYGPAYLARARLGQGAFRVLVTDAYTRRCAITGERTLPVLQAAHIKPYARSGPNRIDNGILLRSDLHILFDKGLLTIDKQHRVEVSRRIREEYENGRDYYALRGKPLAVLPERPAERPSPDFIAWHNEEIFRG